jgi:hypothetical protein
MSLNLSYIQTKSQEFLLPFLCIEFSLKLFQKNIVNMDIIEIIEEDNNTAADKNDSPMETQNVSYSFMTTYNL